MFTVRGSALGGQNRRSFYLAGSGVTSGCELPAVCAGNQTRAFVRATHIHNHAAIGPPAHFDLLCFHFIQFKLVGHFPSGFLFGPCSDLVTQIFSPQIFEDFQRSFCSSFNLIPL